MKLEKHLVCASCLTVGITDPNCVCCYMNNYETIELEYEVCECCNRLISDGEPADTEFNTEQFAKQN